MKIYYNDTGVSVTFAMSENLIFKITVFPQMNKIIKVELKEVGWKGGN
jgi:hypothetical protein